MAHDHPEAHAVVQEIAGYKAGKPACQAELKGGNECSAVKAQAGHQQDNGISVRHQEKQHARKACQHHHAGRNEGHAPGIIGKGAQVVRA